MLNITKLINQGKYSSGETPWFSMKRQKISDEASSRRMGRQPGGGATLGEKEIEMDNLIHELARARQIETGYKRDLERIQDEIQIAYGDALDRAKHALEIARADTTHLESIVRQDALGEHQETGNKHPHPAVTIKVYQTLGYAPGDAFHYCVEHLTTALKMDKRKFEKVAKVAELDFVSFAEEPRATIARDLSAYEEDQ